MKPLAPARLARARDTLPTALRQSMDRYRVTTERLGAAAGVHHSKISRWRDETNPTCPNTTHIQRIADSGDPACRSVALDLLGWLAVRLGGSVASVEPDGLTVTQRAHRLTVELTDVLRTGCVDRGEIVEAMHALGQALAAMDEEAARAAEVELVG